MNRRRLLLGWLALALSGVAPCWSSGGKTASFVWPDWARTARIAGAFFDLGTTPADMDARLDALVSQHVNVVLANSPWGGSYSAWVDDTTFTAIRNMVAVIVQKAHARGLKVVMYQTGLELLSPPGRNPGLEHPDWPQRSLDGQPVLFNDIYTTQVHWLEPGTWDLWISPASSFRNFTIARMREVVRTGVDGLWVDTVYLPWSMGSHENLWPSSDAASSAAFHAATGLNMPTTAEQWDDPTWRRWVIWRHAQLRDFLIALKDAARSVNPAMVFFEENANADATGATSSGNDPTEYLAYPDMSTGHEVDTIGFRVDLGQTGMSSATLDQWLSFRTMIAFACGADRGKPSWILTYGYQPRDSAQLAGMVLAEGASFYETKGPDMAATVGEAYRSQLFSWIALHEIDLYRGQSAAQVGLVYSARTRDLLDGVSGEHYDVQDSVHFAAYRTVANRLYRAHIPFDVVLDTDVSAFTPSSRYSVLIVPEVQAMSNATAAALRSFRGRLITIGDTGRYDEWMNERAQNALAGAPQDPFTTATAPGILTIANTGLLTTTAPPQVQLSWRRSQIGYSLVIVNTASTPAGAFSVSVSGSVWAGCYIAQVRLAKPGSPDVALSCLWQSGRLCLDVPAGIDTLAVLSVMTLIDPRAVKHFELYK